MLVSLMYSENHLLVIKLKGVLKWILVEQHKLMVGKLNHDHLQLQIALYGMNTIQTIHAKVPLIP